ncbi:MAG: hypothetical protein SFW09_06000 [Hyphomicrobiaceae bacterium]|nr:hypothetical protein [Hyphomicrobiaceae bacterium]
MNENLLKTLAVGIFGAAALVLLAPSIAAGAKPIVRRGIKVAVKGYAQGMETLAELQELAEDAYAEALAELQEEAATGSERRPAEPRPADEAVLAAEEADGGEPKRKTRPR